MKPNSNNRYFLSSEKRNLVIFSILILFFVFFSEYFFFSKRNQKSIESKVKNHVFHSDVALFANKKLSRKFLVKLKIPYHKNVSEIVYGNHIYGYFKITEKNIKFDGQNLIFSIIPPGYKNPINFYDHKLKIYEKKFNPVDSSILKEITVQTKGQMSHHLYLLSAVFYPSISRDQKRSYFPIILNRIGEIIWAYIPDKGSKNFRKYPVIKQVGKGIYGILYGEKWSYFEIFNFKGKRLLKLKPKDAKPSYVIHHDFILSDDFRSLITFGHSLGQINPIFTKIINQDLFSILYKPFSLLSNPIIKVDLKNNFASTLNEPLYTMDTLYGFTLKNHPDFFNEVMKTKPRFFTKWNLKNAQIDWLHANSLQQTPEGYLVSFRNINKLIMFSDDFKKINWTLGNEKTDTFYIANDHEQFFHQHHASMLEDGRIILLDNQSGPEKKFRRGSRIIILKRDPLLGIARVDWEYTATDYLNIGNRGSVERLQNGNILAFFPNSLLEKDHLIEVDYQTKKPVGHFAIYFAEIKKQMSENQKKWILDNKKFDLLRPITKGGGNRVVPINTIGNEEFVGYEY
jgi:hypothetical protein